jgi:hypothetical protein
MGATSVGRAQTATVMVVQDTRRVRNIDARYSLYTTCAKRDEHRARASQLRRGTEREGATSAHRCLLVQVEPQCPFLKLLLRSERLRLREAKITWVRLMLHIVVGCGRNTPTVLSVATPHCVYCNQVLKCSVWWVVGRDHTAPLMPFRFHTPREIELAVGGETMHTRVQTSNASTQGSLIATPLHTECVTCIDVRANAKHGRCRERP